MKPTIGGLDDFDINEHLCLAAARRAGRSDPIVDDSGVVVRVHQEDLCQALSVHPDRKDEVDGGPGAEQIGRLIRMWALHAGFLALEVSPTVPTPVLAEAWRGGSRQASLSRFLALRTTEPLTHEQAKAVGALAARAAHDDIIDVTVVEGAFHRHDAIVTSNPTYIRKIADATRARLPIETV